MGHSLANIRKPAFTLSYVLAFVVLTQAARAERRSWPMVITLAALVGFVGLASLTFAPIVLVLWAGLEAVHLLKSRRAGYFMRGALVRSACGLALAALLQLAGSLSSYIVGDSVPSGLSLGTSEVFGFWRLLGTLDQLPGGIGLVGLGPLAAASLAALLARRDRLVLALAAGTGMLLLVPLVLEYDPVPKDLSRLEGHARNLSMFALLIALAIRLAALRSARWRYAASAAIVALITWPTIVAPVRHVGLAVGNGVELANAQPKQIAPAPVF